MGEDYENMPRYRRINEAGEALQDRRSGKDRRIGEKKKDGNEKRKAAGAGVIDGPALLEMNNITGLDMVEGLARFGGNEKIYRQVLHSYITNTRRILETVKEIREDNVENYIFAVHGIKASSRGIGAETVGALAEALEKMAKVGDSDFLRENHQTFLETADELMNAIDAALGKIAAEKPEKDKPDADVLLKISAACEKYDIDELDAAMADLEAYQYKSDDGLSVWLRENVDRMNYEDIRSRLSS
jgi:HPt (histidine-containing phosphotransfer) domain-containing protein